MGDLTELTMDDFERKADKLKAVSPPLPVMTLGNTVEHLRRKIDFMSSDYPNADAYLLGNGEFDSGGYLCGAVTFYKTLDSKVE